MEAVTWISSSARRRRFAKRMAQVVLPRSVVAWRGPGHAVGRKQVALTFDDGPDELTAAYLSVLSRFGVRATFFVVGDFCERRRDLVRAIADAGHELGGHGYTHKKFPSLSRAELADELNRTAALLPREASRRRLVRPPHGDVSPASLLVCAAHGFTTALWSHDSGDSRTRSANDVCAAFADVEASRSGAVVLLHEGQSWTLDALPRILQSLERTGHELVTMGELLHG